MSGGIVIIGAGHGGVQAAASLRSEGYDGPVTLISADPELPYHKPPLSKAFLKASDAELQVLKGEAFYPDQMIALRFGQTVAAINTASRTLTVDGERLDYDKLLIATGARPRSLSIAGADLAGVLTLREASDAAKLRAAMSAAKSAVVIGGGFIGLEAAATFAVKGIAVTVLEMAPRILGRAVSQTVSAHMQSYLEGLGIKVLTGTGVNAIIGKNGHVSAVEDAGGVSHPADLVLAGIGAMPNVELAQAAGIACDNGILVDKGMRTSAADVFAIGDCVNFPHARSGRRVRLESVQNATDQARTAARTMLGHDEAYDAVAWFWSDQGERKLQMAGLAFDPDRQVIAGDPATGAFSVYLFRGDTLLAVDSVNKPGDHMLARRMIAAGFAPTEAQIAGGPAALKQALADFETAKG